MAEGAHGESHERDKETRRQIGQGRQQRVETTSAISYSQCFVAKVGRFWWVELVQLAVEDIEAVEAHLRLHDRRVTYTRAV